MSIENPGMATGSYEFSETENGVIRKTAGACKAWGVIAVVVGGLTLLQALLVVGDAEGVTIILQVISGIVNVVVGIVFVLTAGALKAVVETKGNDIAYMMIAMKKLTVAFMVQITAILIIFVIGFVAGILSAM